MNVPEKMPGENQKDYVMRVIRDSIVNWELPPGMLVSENKLADELGVSRIQVREAFKGLEKTKIVEIYPQRGTRIAPLDYDLIQEAEFIRRVMDCSVVGLTCELAGELDYAWFERHLGRQAYVWENGSPQQMKQLDQEYHRHFYEICKKMQCYEHVQAMNIHFERVRHISYLLDGNIKLVEDHREIFEAVKNKDAQLAKDTVIKHLVRYRVEREETDRMSLELIRRNTCLSQVGAQKCRDEAVCTRHKGGAQKKGLSR